MMYVFTQKAEGRGIMLTILLCLVYLISVVKTDRKTSIPEDYSDELSSEFYGFIPFPSQITLPEKSFLLTDNSTLTIGSTELQDIKVLILKTPGPRKRPCTIGDVNTTLIPSTAVLRDQNQRIVYKGSVKLSSYGANNVLKASCKDPCTIGVVGGQVNFPSGPMLCKLTREGLTVEWTKSPTKSKSISSTMDADSDDVDMRTTAMTDLLDLDFPTHEKEMTEVYLSKYLGSSLADALQKYIDPQLTKDWLNN